jgi:dynein light chain Tctex-type 1
MCLLTLSEACESALAPASSYVHASTNEWNTTIINTILQKLVESTTSEAQPQPQYKYIVNSTIIQHAPGGDGGRRGMHAASGAYWNNEKDGMWSFKYEAAEGKGLDVVVGVIWVWLG